MKTLHLSIITISVILTYTSAYAYNSTDYGNLSYLNQNQSTPKTISNGPLPTPPVIQKRMFDWCQAPRNDMGEIDPTISQFVLANDPKVLENVHDTDTKNRVINEQYWNILQAELISNTTEFKSLGGNKSSIQFLSGLTLNSCPPITAINGTFMTHYNESYNFLLNYDANTFSYNFSKYTLPSYSVHVGSSNTGKNELTMPRIDSPLKQFKAGTPANDVKCNDGLQLLIKAEDGSPVCVSSDTAQKLIERGWALYYANTNDKESISLLAYQGTSIETFYNNGTVASNFTINVNINNFKPSNSLLILQVYYNDGTLYKTINVSSNMIQPDGFYKYQLVAISNKNHPPPFKVVATYNIETAVAYAPVFAHP